jgi:hypothetical protein
MTTWESYNKRVTLHFENQHDPNIKDESCIRCYPLADEEKSVAFGIFSKWFKKKYDFFNFTAMTIFHVNMLAITEKDDEIAELI